MFYLYLSGLAYGFRDYSLHLIAISAMVGVGSVILFWLPESPRWLIARYCSEISPTQLILLLLSPLQV